MNENQIGHYEILEMLGRGGMGVVYKAFDRNLEREVALKVMHAGLMNEEEQIIRFLQEAKAIAKLQHPNIVGIYEVGRDPQPYFAIEYIQGQTLAQYIQTQGSFNPRDAANILRKICDAIQCAHEKNIIHRDLKPANIMLTQEMEPKVMDFGLAKFLDAAVTISKSGHLVGTPFYMSPEQACDEKVDIRTDIYALGAIFYEMLCGSPPFHGSTVINIFDQIVHKTPDPPSMIRPNIPVELENICLKCLSKNPIQRFTNASELKRQIDSFLFREETSANTQETLVFTSNMLPTFFPQIKRYRWALIGLSAFVVVLLLLLFWAVHRNEFHYEQWSSIQTKINQDKEHFDELIQQKEQLYQAELTKYNQASTELTEQQEKLNKALAEVALLQEHIQKLKNEILQKNQLPSLPPDVIQMNFDCPVARDILISDSGRITLVNILGIYCFRHSQYITSVAFSPDGKYILSGSYDKTVKLWDRRTGRMVRNFVGHTDWVSSVAFSPDGKYIISSSADKSIRLWDQISGRLIRQYLPVEGPCAVAISNDGNYLAAGGADKIIRIWQLQTGEFLRSFVGHTNRINSIAFSPDSTLLLSGSTDNSIKLWNANTGLSIRDFVGHSNRVTSVAFSHDGKLILSGSDDKTIKSWDRETGKVIRSFVGHEGQVTSVAFSPDNQYILSGSYDRIVKLWSCRMAVATSYPGHHNKISSVAFSPDGNFGVSGSYDNMLRLWDLRSGEEIVPYPQGHTDRVNFIAFSPDGKSLATASDDGSIKIWDLKTSKLIQTFKGIARGGMVAFSPDGKCLASMVENNTIRMWDVNSGQTIRDFRGHKALIRSISFSPDGSKILSGSYDSLKIWDSQTARLVLDIPAYTSWNSSSLFALGGNAVVADCKDNSIKLCNTQDGSIIREFLGHNGQIMSLDVLPDGQFMVSASDDRIVKLWNIKTGELIREFSHPSSICAIACSPDGKYVATSSTGDQMIRLWKLESGKEVDAILCDGCPTSVVFQPQGEVFAVGNWNTTATVYWWQH